MPLEVDFDERKLAELKAVECGQRNDMLAEVAATEFLNARRRIMLDTGGMNRNLKHCRAFVI
jgi:hypothetical protein